MHNNYVLLIGILAFIFFCSGSLNAFEIIVKTTNLAIGPWYYLAQSTPWLQPNVNDGNVFVVAPTLASLTNQSIYVVGIGQQLAFSNGNYYTPLGSKMTLDYLPFNSSSNNPESIFIFYPENNTYAIPTFYLRKPGLYRLNGIIESGNVLLNQTSQWIGLYNASSIPVQLQNSFGGNNNLTGVGKNLTVLESELTVANNSVSVLSKTVAIDNTTIKQKTQQLVALANNDLLALIISIGSAAMMVLILMVIYMKGSPWKGRKPLRSISNSDSGDENPKTVESYKSTTATEDTGIGKPPEQPQPSDDLAPIYDEEKQQTQETSKESETGTKNTTPDNQKNKDQKDETG